MKEKAYLLENLKTASIECDKHKQKIIRSLSLLTYFPLTTSSYNNLTEIEVEHIDQLIFRFSKLQDSMGKKLIPTSYYLLETESEDISFIDILNKLEKLRILPDTEEWLEFRSLRNELSHEYPDQSDTTVEILNRLINLMPEFLALYNHFIASITERNLLSVTK